MIRTALRMLVGDTAKYLGIVAAITFASLLMTQQAAMFCGIMAQSYAPVDLQPGVDVWVADPSVRYIDDLRPMADTALLRVRGAPGVAWATPLYKGIMKARLPGGGQEDCVVVGVDDATLIGGPPVMVSGDFADVRRAGAVVIDEVSARDKLAARPPGGTVRPMAVGDAFEIDDRRVVVVGICAAEPQFAGGALVYTTYGRAVSSASAERRVLSYVLVGAAPGRDPADVAAAIRETTGLAAYTRDQFKALTLEFILKRTGIAVSFGVGVALSFAIGTVIAGQAFWSFTADHLRHFAVLRAMGATPATLVRMIAAQSTAVGCVGFGLGIGLTCLTAALTAGSELSLSLPWPLLAGAFASVLTICGAAALFSIARVLRLEPAIVFRG